MKRTMFYSVFCIVFLFFLLTGCSVPAGESDTNESRDENAIAEDINELLSLEGAPPADKNEHHQFEGTLSGDLSGRYFVIKHKNSGKYLTIKYGNLALEYWHDVATRDAGEGLWKFSRSRKYQSDNGYNHDYYKIINYRGGTITANIPYSTLKLDGTGGKQICWWIQDRENDGTYLLRSLKDVDYRIYSGSPYNYVELSKNSESGKLFQIAQQDMTTFWGKTYNDPVTIVKP